LDYVPGKADWVAYGLPVEGEDSSTRFVGDSLDRNVPTCRLRDPLTTVKEKAGRSPTGLCPVVTEQGTVLGLCEFDSLPDDPKLVAEDVMKSGPTTLRPSYSIDKAGERLRQSGKKGILVTSSDGRLMGVFAGGSSS
jgi:CBS domain-containing protein